MIKFIFSFCWNAKLLMNHFVKNRHSQEIFWDERCALCQHYLSGRGASFEVRDQGIVCSTCVTYVNDHIEGAEVIGYERSYYDFL